MTTVAAVLVTALIVGFFWHRDRLRLVRRHRISRASWIAMTDEWIGRHAETAAELEDSRAHARDLRADLEWQSLENTVLQAELDCHFLMPTIDGTRAAHRAKVTPIRGVGR